MIRYGFARREAEPFLAVFQEWVVENGGGPSYNAYRIEEAWKAVSGTQEHTTRTFFKDGILYVALDSSVLRSHLSRLTDSMRVALNTALDRDERFIKGYSFSRKVDKIVLK